METDPRDAHGGDDSSQSKDRDPTQAIPDLPGDTPTVENTEDELLATPTGAFFAGEPVVAAHPERVGPYRVRRVLGQGGMGVVYLAEQTEPVQRPVALKLIRSGMDTREIVARFESERQTLAVMNHPNIARVYDAGTAEDSRPYFVMELVVGIPLTLYCDRRGLSLERRLDLFVNVCSGIQHAHQKAIIHRDLKPSNVIVTEQDGNSIPKIIDFGIAKALAQSVDDNTALTRVGQLIGTPEYMSPEQASSNEQAVDTRTDIYSLGVMLYEMLVGVLPFDSSRLRKSGVAEVLRIICEEDPVRPSTRLSRLKADERVTAFTRDESTRQKTVRALRGDLDWICLKALEKVPARRYDSASELAADIRRYREHQPVLARPPSVVYVTRKYLRRYRGQVAAVLALVLVVMGFFIFERLRLESEVVEIETALPGYIELYEQHKEARDDAESEHQRLVEKLFADKELWKPPWERREEFNALDRQRAYQKAMDEAYFSAITDHKRATELLPEGSPRLLEINKRMGKLDFLLYSASGREAQVKVSKDFFAAKIRALKIEEYNRRLEGQGRVRLTSSPSEADIFCFRYEPQEAHRVPLPFDPVAGLEDPKQGRLGEPRLVIDCVFDPDACPFSTEDRLLTLDGKNVHRRGEVAEYLQNVNEREAVTVRIKRRGKEQEIRWIPFPEESPEIETGRVVDFHTQFGFSFKGYPLEFHPGARIGITSGSAVEIDLPRGSYLFVFKKDGYLDTRLPVAMPTERPDEDKVRRVRLLNPESVPDGFVHIPGGPFRCGSSDRRDAVYKARKPEVKDVPGFLMSRQEVTIREYLDFLNDPTISAALQKQNEETDSDRKVIGQLINRSVLLADWQSERLAPFLPGPKERIYFSPYVSRKHIVEFDDGKWRIRRDLDPPLELEYPVFGLSMIAAVEYAAWRSQREATGEPRFRYRLPTDLEWEKAARGADARRYVWGNYLILSFCQSAYGDLFAEFRGKHTFGGSHPLDESVYGVQDLAGSVSEPTTTRADSVLRMWIYRGGSLDATDPADYHCASRNRAYVQFIRRRLGIRLVAELP